jgi:hypothetical protein
MLIATEGTFIDTFRFNLTVSFYNYLVYDPSPFPSSGQAINSILTSLGYIGRYTANILSEPTLAVYRSIFICVGVYPNAYRITAYGPEAMAIINYLNQGGRVYLEGGDVWYADPLVGGHNFCSRFGMEGFTDGYSDMGPILGQTGTFTQDMYFNYGGDNQNMDHINPTTGYLIFADGNNGYYCGVAYNPGTYRTVGTSFQLGGLIDANAPSTKAVLLDSIMRFFGSPLPGIEDDYRLNTIGQPLKIYPNPVKSGNSVRIQLIPISNLKIYNTAGDCIKTIPVNNNNNTHTIIWNGTNENGLHVPAGIYYVKIDLDKKMLIERIIIIK